MSAGTGVQHSEANESATDPLHFFKFGFSLKKIIYNPRYDQRTFDVNERINKWKYIVSSNEADKGLWINQDARLALTTLKAGNELTYNNSFKGNGVLVVINGAAKVEDTLLGKRDALGISNTNSFTITASEDAEVLAIEAPMN